MPTGLACLLIFRRQALNNFQKLKIRGTLDVAPWWLSIFGDLKDCFTKNLQVSTPWLGVSPSVAGNSKTDYLNLNITQNLTLPQKPLSNPCVFSKYLYPGTLVPLQRAEEARSQPDSWVMEEIRCLYLILHFECFSTLQLPGVIDVSLALALWDLKHKPDVRAEWLKTITMYYFS